MKAFQWVIVCTCVLLVGGLTYTATMPEDINGDGVVDVEDALRLFSKWHEGQKHTPTPTPTPSTTPLPEITITLAGLPAGATPLVMVRVPAGSFIMGRYTDEQDSFVQEDPQHQVRIGYEFYVGKYEITQAQWQAVMDATPWAGHDSVLNHPDSPAVYVSWQDAQAFITTLNMIGQGTFRLPSEAEWEYGCRADPSGTPTRFYWGDDPGYTDTGNYAWHYYNAWNVNEKYAHVVGLKMPNAWGLYDMSGNVWEWCEDDWHYYIEAGRPDNGNAWMDSPRGSYRVIRGGDFNSAANYCRSAYRDDSAPGGRSAIFGLRVVRNP